MQLKLFKDTSVNKEENDNQGGIAGNSELILGDCLEKMKDIKDNSIDMVLTDPPYGITACKWDNVVPLDLMWKELKRITSSSSAIIMTSVQPFTSLLINSNIKDFKYCWYWLKNFKTGHLNAKKQPMRDVEDIVVFYKKTSHV